MVNCHLEGGYYDSEWRIADKEQYFYQMSSRKCFIRDPQQLHFINASKVLDSPAFGGTPLQAVAHYDTPE